MNSRIYALDDDQSLLEVLTLLLQDAYDLHVFPEVALFEKAMVEQLPDLIIIDYRLKGITGADVCRQIKSRSDLEHLPIIMISAVPRVHIEELDCPYDVLIEKPFDVELIEQEIIRLLGERK